MNISSGASSARRYEPYHFSWYPQKEVSLVMEAANKIEKKVEPAVWYTKTGIQTVILVITAIASLVLTVLSFSFTDKHHHQFNCTGTVLKSGAPTDVSPIGRITGGLGILLLISNIAMIFYGCITDYTVRRVEHAASKNNTKIDMLKKESLEKMGLILGCRLVPKNEEVNEFVKRLRTKEKSFGFDPFGEIEAEIFMSLQDAKFDYAESLCLSAKEGNPSRMVKLFLFEALINYIKAINETKKINNFSVDLEKRALLSNYYQSACRGLDYYLINDPDHKEALFIRAQILFNLSKIVTLAENEALQIVSDLTQVIKEREKNHPYQNFFAFYLRGICQGKLASPRQSNEVEKAHDDFKEAYIIITSNKSLIKDVNLGTLKEQPECDLLGDLKPIAKFFCDYLDFCENYSKQTNRKTVYDVRWVKECKILETLKTTGFLKKIIDKYPAFKTKFLP